MRIYIRVRPVCMSLLLALPRQLQHATRDEAIYFLFREGYPYELILCFLAAVFGVCISLSTLKRSLRRQHLRRRGVRNSLWHVGRCLLNELDQSSAQLGYRTMQARLRLKYGIQIPRNILRVMMTAVDPIGVKLRKNNRLTRRRYGSKGPNFCWHMDGNDKLKPYGFSIHGCIDGFSRKLIWLEVSQTNKDSAVIAGYYLDAVKRYGLPRLVRCDRGTENAKVAFLQPFLRRNGQDMSSGVKSFQYGCSVTNQRIERFWGTLRKWCLDWWIEFFKLLKDNGYLDESNPIHSQCLCFTFMDLIQKELDDVCHIWNTHVIRYSRGGVSGRPNELYFLPTIHGYKDCKFQHDAQDLEFCKQYTAPKPAPARIEFLELVDILLEENDWYIPTSNCEESLMLFLNLINEIEN